MNIAEAWADEELFARHFRGETWAAWGAFLKAVAGLGAEMTEAEAETFRQHTGRTALPAEPSREVTLIVGRRGGKSRVLAFLACYLATCRDYAAHVAPGEVPTVAIIAADRRQARVILRYVQGLLRASPLLADLIEAEAVESVTLSNGVQIEVATASYRVTRGYSFAAVLADEVAFWQDAETAANPAEEILRAVRPGLATIPGSMLLKASSPHAKRGPLYQDYRRHYGQDGARVFVWKAPSLAMNPSLPADVVEEAYEADPQSAAAEFGGEFRDDLADYISRETVDRATIPGRVELPRSSSALHVGFCDPSGGSNDSMTLAIAHREGERVVLDLLRETPAPFSPDAVVAEFAATLKAYGLSTVTGDRYGGEWPAERFRVHGVTYQPADKVKSELYRSLLPLLNSGRAELLDVPRLASQLASLERRTARGGRDSIDHAPGGHDDVANAAAGALVLAEGGGSGSYDIFGFLGLNPDGSPKR